MKKQTLTNYCFLLLFSFILTGCASVTPPQNPHNLCKIFQEKPSWYSDAKRANKRWGTPIQVMMSIMFQESSYRHDALPPRPWFLFIPLPRTSSAYGYAQAQNPAWKDYLKETGRSWFKSRDDFEDAIDFIGWYTNKTRRINGVSLWRADLLYLNYHEGWGGYRKKSWRKNRTLIAIAKKVQKRASQYGAQLRRCRL